MSFDDINNTLTKSGGPTIKLNVGESAVFDVLDAEYRQRTDFKTGAPLHYKDGRPRMQLVLSVQREGVEDEERVFMHWSAEKSLGDVLKKTGQKLERGSRIKLTRLPDGTPAVRGEDPPQSYVVEHKPAPLTQPAAGDF